MTLRLVQEFQMISVNFLFFLRVAAVNKVEIDIAKKKPLRH